MDFDSILLAKKLGGSSTTIEALSVTENGTYTAQEGKAYSPVTVNVSGGSSGATIVASGTFTGSGANNVTVPIGTKMAKTDCAIYFYIDDDSIIEDGYYKFVNSGWLIVKEVSYLDFSSYKNNIIPTSARSYAVGESQVTGLNGYWYASQNLNTTTVRVAMQSVFNISYGATGFSFATSQGNQYYRFPSTATYRWKVVYFGNDPDNDIVEVEQ